MTYWHGGAQAWGGNDNTHNGPVLCWAYLTLHGLAGQNTERKTRLQVRPFYLPSPFLSSGVKKRLCCAARHYAVDMHRR